MSRRALLAGGIAVAAAGATAAAVAVGLRATAAPPPPRAGIGLSASISPPTALFGQQVVASLDVVVDRRAVRPASLDLRGGFAPYVPAAPVASLGSDAGPVARIRFRATLRCVELACLPPDPARGGGAGVVRLPPAQLRFLRTDGRAGRLAVRWPRFDVVSRLPASVAAAANPAKQPAFRASLALPAVTYSASPALLERLLAAGGALLLVAAAALAVVVARPALAHGRVRRRRRRGPAGLERALLLLRRARADGSEPDRRKALELLALELRRSGDAELAGSATTLAWAEPPPADGETDGLAAAVRRRLEGEANGRAR